MNDEVKLKNCPFCAERLLFDARITGFLYNVLTTMLIAIWYS